MELWVKIDGAKKKFQGSFFKVMEEVFNEGKNAEKVEILSFWAHDKERRRLKRELRKYNKDLIKTASALVCWFYTKQIRSLKRREKELIERTKRKSEGFQKEIEKIENQIKELEEKITNFKVN